MASVPTTADMAANRSKAFLRYALRSSVDIMPQLGEALRQKVSEDGKPPWLSIHCTHEDNMLVMPRGTLEADLILLWEVPLLDDSTRSLVYSLQPGDLLVRMWCPEATHLSAAFIFPLEVLETPVPDAKAYFTELVLKEFEPAPSRGLPNACAHCAAQSERLQRCSRCKRVCYCQASCQQVDWQQWHRLECKQFIRLDSYKGTWFNAAQQ